MKISRLTFLVCASLAIPFFLSAQETKLVSCRSLEAAGNFVGPDEVIEGDRVCKKAKPGDVSTAKPEPEKPVPATNAIPNAQPVSVAEAARANAAAKAAAKKAAAQKDAEPARPAQQESATSEPAKTAAPQAAVAAMPTQVPNVTRATPAAEPAQAPAPVAPAAVRPTAPAVPASNPPRPTAAPAEESGPAFTSANAPAVKAQHVATPLSSATQSASTAATSPALTVRAHRDAPVAPGTPSEPPEIDHGFSDANAVEVPATAGNGAAVARPVQSSAHNVQVGGFEKSDLKSTAAEPAQTACAKNITVGSLRDGQLSLVMPGWAQKWIANNQSRLASICFSPAARAGARSYLIVFYAAPGNGQSGGSAAMPLPDAGGGAGDFTTKDSSTWHYSAERSDSAGTSAAGGVTQVWYATAYTEQGAPVAERWPDSSKRGDEERASEDLLNAVVEDLRKL